MLPAHAPFSTEQRALLDPLLSTFDITQKAWLSGFLVATQAAPLAPLSSGKLTVLYGTESGNSESLADRAVKTARKRGATAAMINMADLKPSELSGVGNLLVVVSTWGDGEPPETAVSFYNALMSESPDLRDLKFSVCALGDTSYEQFCATGKAIDARLEALGATRVAERADCDVDYEETYAAWLERGLSALLTEAVRPPAGPALATVGTLFDKKKPFPATLNEAVLLNGEGSSKETFHLEFSLDGSGMHYEPGDSLAVHPVNAPDLVAEVIAAAKLKGTEPIETKSSGKKLLADALREDFDITTLSKNVLIKLAEASGSKVLAQLLDEAAKDPLKEYLAGRQIVDALMDFAPSGLSSDSLVGLFRKLPPRLYSIASSPLAHPGEVHLTVSAVRYDSHGKRRKGVASTFLADLVKPGDTVPVFVQPNKNFRLPTSGDTPIIMVGPGTGVAPFRAFVEHRAATDAKGDSWLFLGDQHYLYDFLYQLEWQDHLKSGALSRLNVAFSRDQPEKIYVQHRMGQYGAELFSWLENGAHFYVCGDATHMAADVHECLLRIVETHGSRSREQAIEYVEALKKSKRYQRDVY
jgi:sulfite reductase (NADPH) flavoprotein alpha-component